MKTLLAASIEALNAMKLTLILHAQHEEKDQAGDFGGLSFPNTLDPKAHEQVVVAAQALSDSIGFKGSVLDPEQKLTRVVDGSERALKDPVSGFSTGADWKCPTCRGPLAAIDKVSDACICTRGHESH